MARIVGPLHTDRATGQVGGITYRGYRGASVVSSSRMKVALPPKVAKLTSPQDLKACFARWNMGTRYTLHDVAGTLYLRSVEDLVGGFGILEQLSEPKMPLWYPGHPAHNNRPYTKPDGINDLMLTAKLATALPTPLEIWMVASDMTPPPSGPFNYFDLLSTAYRGLRSYIHPYDQYWSEPAVYPLAPYSDKSIKLWRIILTGSTIQIEWNGIPQTPPKSLTLPKIDQLTMFSHYNIGYYGYNYLFEFDIFNAILTPVERALLINWFNEWFNLP